MNRLTMQTLSLTTLRQKAAALTGKAKRGVRSLGAAAATAMILSMPAYASTGSGGKDIWIWLTEALADVYNKFAAVSTIAACVAASICLIMMNFSTDDRAVSSSRSWLKRILICWVVLNVLGFIMAYLVPLTAGGQYVLPGNP